MTPEFHSGDGGSNPPHRIFLKLVETKKDRNDFNKIVSIYHGYKKTTNYVGREINWLVLDEDTHKCYGVIGIGSAVMALKPRDEFIGWDKETRLKKVGKNIANNWRFCMIVKGLGSQVLKLLHREAPREWKNKYGDKLVLLETLVEPPYTGKVYKASGWLFLGYTKGLQFKWKTEDELEEGDKIVKDTFEIEGKVEKKYKVVVGTNKPKMIFVKPLTKNWKKFLNRKMSVDEIRRIKKEIYKSVEKCPKCGKEVKPWLVGDFKVVKCECGYYSRKRVIF